MNVSEKIKYHCENKKYCKISRKVGKHAYEKTHGFIVDYNESFVVVQENHDFLICGYLIFPLTSISKIGFNRNDKYFHKILRLEGVTTIVCNKHKIDLSSWDNIFESIKSLGFNIIIKNEDPEDESFDVGPTTKITRNSVFIRYFNAQGFLDDEPTEITWDKITLVKFDDHYINTFSKYLRERKPKKTKTKIED